VMEKPPFPPTFLPAGATAAGTTREG